MIYQMILIGFCPLTVTHLLSFDITFVHNFRLINCAFIQITCIHFLILLLEFMELIHYFFHIHLVICLNLKAQLDLYLNLNYRNLRIWNFKEPSLFGNWEVCPLTHMENHSIEFYFSNYLNLLCSSFVDPCHSHKMFCCLHQDWL